MKRPVLIGVLAAAIAITLISLFLLRQNTSTTEISPIETRPEPTGKSSPKSRPNTADKKNWKSGTPVLNATSPSGEIHPSNRPQIEPIEDLRALATASKHEAELCSRKQLDPIAKKFQRLVKQPDGEQYLRQAAHWASELSDIPTIAPSSSKALETLASDAGHTLSEQELVGLVSSLKYCDAIAFFDVMKSMFALLDRYPGDRELKAKLSAPLMRFMLGSGREPSHLLHQFIRIEILRGAFRTGLLDASQSTLIDTLIAEGKRHGEDARKDVEALSAGGEAAKAFRSELDKSERLRAKINEALRRL